MLFENAGEIRQIVEADLKANVRYRQIRLNEQLRRLFDAQVDQVVVKRFAGEMLEQVAKIRLR